MSEIPARVWFDQNTGRLQVTITDPPVGLRRPELRHANLRVEWSHGSWAESSISAPKRPTKPTRTRQTGSDETAAPTENS